MKANKGFTLIELAVVIAIIGILAAVAIPRFGDTTIQAEKSKAKDLAAQLTSAAALYTAEQGEVPDGLGRFMEFTATNASKPKTISIASLGATNSCGSPGNAATTMTCNFKTWNVTYNYSGGSVYVTNATGVGSNKTGTYADFKK